MPGIFFFGLALNAASGAPLDLAAELFSEGNWAAARIEALRAQAETAGPEADRGRLLAAVSMLRLGVERTEVKAALASLWRDESALLETRCMAAYELGLADWTDAGTNAPTALEFAYLHTRQVPLFWRAGCSLYFYLKTDRRLRREKAAVWQSLQSCRDAWPLEVWRECRPRRKAANAIGSLPGKWIVQFYRSQIGPAIGARCDLEPSCSEYFRQASRAHGLLGIPVMADRFVREPSVVAAKENPVTMPDGRIRYADPLSDHDAWLKGTP